MRLLISFASESSKDSKALHSRPSIINFFLDDSDDSEEKFYGSNPSLSLGDPLEEKEEPAAEPGRCNWTFSGCWNYMISLAWLDLLLSGEVLDANGDLERLDEQGWSPIALATYHGHIRVVELMCDNQVNPMTKRSNVGGKAELVPNAFNISLLRIFCCTNVEAIVAVSVGARRV